MKNQFFKSYPGLAPAVMDRIFLEDVTSCLTEANLSMKTQNTSLVDIENQLYRPNPKSGKQRPDYCVETINAAMGILFEKVKSHTVKYEAYDSILRAPATAPAGFVGSEEWARSPAPNLSASAPAVHQAPTVGVNAETPLYADGGVPYRPNHGGNYFEVSAAPRSFALTSSDPTQLSATSADLNALFSSFSTASSANYASHLTRGSSVTMAHQPAYSSPASAHGNTVYGASFPVPQYGSQAPHSQGYGYSTQSINAPPPSLSYFPQHPPATQASQPSSLSSQLMDTVISPVSATFKLLSGLVPSTVQSLYHYPTPVLMGSFYNLEPQYTCPEERAYRYCRSKNLAFLKRCPHTHYSGHVPQEPSYQPIDPKSDEFIVIKEDFIRNWKLRKVPEVTRIERVTCDPAVQKAFDVKSNDLNRRGITGSLRQLYHGTHDDNIDRVLKHGFRPPADYGVHANCTAFGKYVAIGTAPVTSPCGVDCIACTSEQHKWNKCHMFGLGVYFADQSSKSDRYVRGSLGTTRRMLLADVLLGDPYIANCLTREDEYHDLIIAPENKDSVIAVGRYGAKSGREVINNECTRLDRRREPPLTTKMMPPSPFWDLSLNQFFFFPLNGFSLFSL